MNRAGPAALLAAVLLLLAACAGAPSSGPVQPGMQGPVPAAADPLVRPLANPPRPGMSQLEIVAGFLSATAAVGDSYQVAREYLDPAAAQTWDPGAGVRVMADERAALSQSGEVVTATFQQIGSVGAAGVVVATAAAEQSLPFPTAQVAGEWRITAPPEGLLLSSISLERAYELRNVYFIEPSGAFAVPDPRLLPRTGDEALATGLVDALLAGPSAWLDPAVMTEVPADTELALGAVPVSNGVARVELVGPAADLDDAALERFGAQMAWTLRQVPGLEAFEVTLSGDRVPLGTGRGPVPVTEYDSFLPDVVAGEVPLYGVAQDGAAVVAAGGESEPIDVGAGAPALQSIAVMPAGLTVAGVAEGGSALVVGRLRAGEEPVAVVEGTVLGRPSIDGLGRIWWVDERGVLRMATATATPVAVAVENAPEGLVGVDVSRDGTRALLRFGTSGNETLSMGVVVGGTDGMRIQGVRPLAEADGAADAAWGSAEEVTVLGRGDGVIRRLDLLGEVIGVFNVSEESRVLTDAPDSAVAIGLADGSAGPLTGSGVRVVADLSQPAYPG